MATTIKTKINFDSGDYLITDLPLNGHITEHFTWDEYGNKSASDDIKCEIWPQSLIHAEILEIVRNEWCKYKNIPDNIGIVMSSDYRTESFNKQVGGVEKSLHRWGCAGDLQLGSLTSTDKQWLVNLVTNLGKQFATQIEIGWYSWGSHIGSHLEIFNPYTTLPVYVFDGRS